MVIIPESTGGSARARWPVPPGAVCYGVGRVGQQQLSSFAATELTRPLDCLPVVTNECTNTMSAGLWTSLLWSGNPSSIVCNGPVYTRVPDYLQPPLCSARALLDQHRSPHVWAAHRAQRVPLFGANEVIQIKRRLSIMHHTEHTGGRVYIQRTVEG